jgi:hypothetical protein
MAQPFCLVLAIWGDVYRSAHVNELAREARRLSPDLAEVVLFTDCPRDGIDSDICQTLFPAYFARPDFFLGGYRAKLAIFTREALPPGRRCIYVDLDSIVTGDLGRIVGLVQTPQDFWMMPPAGLGFGRLRRLVDLARGDRHYPVGNSSIMAFHSDAKMNITEAFQVRHAAGIDIDTRYMCVDDIFISWVMRDRLRGIPKSLAVYFRREFMARAWPILWLRLASPFRRHRRAGLIAITFNGLSVKPERLVVLPEGAAIRDKHGRVGIWSDAFVGSIRKKIIASCHRVLGG